MRLGKRSLAGVAAGALVAGLVPFAVVATATSANAVAYTGSVTAVRAGTVGSIPYATLSYSKASQPFTTLTVVSAPSAAARMWVDGTISAVGERPVSADDSAVLGSPLTFTARTGIVSGDDSRVGVAVDTAGSYVASVGNGTDTTTFSFTTTGAPTSMTLTPSSQTVLVGEAATVTATLKDANGATTQPAWVDTIGIADNTSDTVTPTSVTSTDIFDGTANLSLSTTGNPAGTTTITATPQGTLPGSGVTTQTATVTKSGTIADKAVVNLAVTAPATALNDPATGAAQTRTVQVPANSSTVTIAIDDTTANAAGSTLRFGVNLNAAAVAAGSTINGSLITALDDTEYVTAVTSASRTASITLTLGGGAVNTGAVISVFQAKVDGTAVAAAPASPTITISQLAPQVYPSSIAVSPDDSYVAKLGTTTSVTVTVEDSFGTPQSGWVVQARRGPTTILTTGTTNASGEASVAVTNASTAVNGTVESYTFVANPPIGSSVTAASGLQITYTTEGTITLLTVNATAGTSVTSSAPTQTKGASFLIPNAGVLAGAPAPATATFTLSTGLDDTTAISANYAAFQVVTDPRTSATITTPEGVFVTDDTTTATWSNGERSLLAASGSDFYVYGTKTGVHTVTVAAGGKTLDVKVKIGNTAAMAYNIALAPKTQSLAAGAIGTATLTVTDIFGNAVDTTAANGSVRISASGDVLLAGFRTSDDFTTGASGTATVTIIAGNTAGTGTLAATPTPGDGATAWQTGYTKPTGAPSPVVSDAATVTVAAQPEEKTIVIVGERTTVKGAAGIAVDGLTTGFADGDKVKPWVRFPGGSYSEGTARPAITDNEFYWERKTGKKTYVYFTNEADDVRSNRIIIPAK